MQQKHYDAIFWIQCETKASLRQSFVDIGIKLELRDRHSEVTFDENLQRVLRWLRHTQKRWLLIYDNAERERENLLKGYWPHNIHGQGSILLTSRSFYNFFEDQNRRGQTVDVLDQEERNELFMTLLGPKWQTQHLGDGKMMAAIERAAIATLLDKTGGLPIAITHATNMILDKSINPTQTVRHFMERFEQSYDTLPERHAAPRDPLVQTLDSIWAIAFANLSPHADTLLSCLSLVAPDSIMMDLFLPSNQERLTPALEFCRSAPPPYDKLASNQPTFHAVIHPSKELEHALDELRIKGLIRIVGREISVHRTVQEAVSFKTGELQACFEAMASLLYDAFPKQRGGGRYLESWTACRMWIQHITSLGTKYQIYSNTRPEDHFPLRGLASTEVFVDLLGQCAW